MENNETLINFKEETFDNGEVLNNVIKIVEEDKTVEDFKKYHADKLEQLEEALLKYMGQSDLKTLKTEFPDNMWKYSVEKLAYPYECFISIDDYQKACLQFKERTHLK